MAVFMDNSLEKSGINLICRFARQGSFPISCCNTLITANFIFLQCGGILKFLKIREFIIKTH